MRIVELIPGTCEAFYCENCLRDFDLLAALDRTEHTMQLVPLYLPLTKGDEDPAAGAPIFFGGINVYLQQKSGFFRRTPRWLDRFFDARWLLRWASHKTAMTSSRDLGETALSMLRGEHGHQAKELDRLTAYLASQPPADVICLSSALLAGLAPALKQRLGLPVVSLLQDEDTFLDSLPDPLSDQAWAILRERAGDLDALVAVSTYFRDAMAARLGVVPEQIDVAPAGLDAGDYAPAAAPPETPVVGFLSPAIPDKGLDRLVEAVAALKGDERLATLKLRATGGETVGSPPYLRDIRARLVEAGLTRDVELLPNLPRPERIAFLQGCSVLSVPATRPEASALPVLEANACGVPVVVPRHGALEEVVETTGGGVLVPPDDPAALHRALADLLLDPAKAREVGQRGREGVLAHLTADHMAEKLIAVMARVRGPGAPAPEGGPDDG